MPDSPEYLKKKAQLSQILTIYGRKPVLEALKQINLPCLRLHLAESNKQAKILSDVLALADQRQIDINYHDRLALSRISKNSKQDQGICLDIHCPKHNRLEDFLKYHHKGRLLALDRITNPQNLGMIIRSACAGQIDGIILPDKGCAKLDALVVKASTGTVFKAPIIRCKDLKSALIKCQQNNTFIVGLSSCSQTPLQTFQEPQSVIYVLGNETEGLSSEIQQLCDNEVVITMNNDVESLNVAVTASLIAFRGII